MPLVPAFTIANNSGIPQNNFLITDTSTGADGTVTKFVVTIYDDTNTQLAGSPITFTYTPNATYNVGILTQDIAVNVVVVWATTGGATVVTTNQIFVFTGFLEWYYYGLVQQVAANNSLFADRGFFLNLSNLRTLIDSANQAINIGGSIFNAQAMILLAQYIQTNNNLFF